LEQPRRPSDADHTPHLDKTSRRGMLRAPQVGSQLARTALLVDPQLTPSLLLDLEVVPSPGTMHRGLHQLPDS
jgi:hypothetical protein